MQLADVPGWIWQLAAVAAGMALGLAVAGWLRNGHNKKQLRHPALPAGGRPSRLASQAEASRLPSESLLAAGNDSVQSQMFAEGPATPERRLMERLRATNKELDAQLRASAVQHSRLLKSKDTEVAALKDQYDEKVETLKQAHAAELKYLISVLLEQLERLRRARAEDLATMGLEIERQRTATGTRADLLSGSVSSAGPNAFIPTVFATTEAVPLDPREP